MNRTKDNMERITIDDGTTWPNPAGEDYRDLAWRLRYAQTELTKADFYNAAAVMNMYSDLIKNPAFTLKTVQKKIRGIRNAINQ